MFQQRQDVIVLCLDIDNTILNWETSFNNNNSVDFNGENVLHYISPYSFRKEDIQWYQLLEDLQQFCLDNKVELNVQIISAKKNYDVDCTVDAVVSALYPFLEPLDCDGQKYTQTLWSAYMMPKQYLYAKHNQKITKHRRRNQLQNNSPVLGLHDDDIKALPTIHIVRGNKEQGRINSKAAVMQYIEKKLIKRNKNPIGMIMVDDRLCFEHEVTACGYRFIGAPLLNAFDQPEHQTLRYQFTTQYLMPKIKKTVETIIKQYNQRQQMYFSALQQSV